MKDRIIAELMAIEEQYQVDILFACESGSRAWGFNSPNSDYDIRFIYKRKTEDYLSLQMSFDTIDIPIRDEIDLVGWELSKALRLLYKSNAPLIEWINSPIIYLNKGVFQEEMLVLSQKYFSQVGMFFHYQSMAHKYVKLCLSEAFSLKKLFYALRTLLTAKWIIEKNENAPVDFEVLCNKSCLDNILYQWIKKLKIAKNMQLENCEIPANALLVDFMVKQLSLNEQNGKKLNSHQEKIDDLDVFFKKTLLSIS